MQSKSSRVSHSVGPVDSECAGSATLVSLADSEPVAVHNFKVLSSPPVASTCPRGCQARVKRPDSCAPSILSTQFGTPLAQAVVAYGARVAESEAEWVALQKNTCPSAPPDTKGCSKRGCHATAVTPK
jgi:hypothetical protein